MATKTAGKRKSPPSRTHSAHASRVKKATEGRGKGTSIRKIQGQRKRTSSKKVLSKQASIKGTAKRAPIKQLRKVRPTGGPRTKKISPTTMEELLAQTGYKLKGVKRGELIEGTITDISRKMVLVDIGGKTEGLVVDKEYDAAREFISELSIGDTIPVYVLTPENDRGQILLSLKKAAADRTWEKFEEAIKTSEVMTVRGVETNRGGVVVRADSVQGFVPSSQFGKKWLGRMEELVEQSFQVRVIEVDREKNRLIFSEKQVSEAEEIKQRAQALKKIQAGEQYEGMVSGLMPFGVFVSVDVPLGTEAQRKGQGAKVKAEDSKSTFGKVEGLVHISEISWEKVEDPNQHFRLGQKVNVKILGIDQESGKLNLSVKRLTPDPWEGIDKKYPSGAKVKGKVSRVAPFGAFVTLAPGIEGLLHISKIPAGEEPEVGSSLDLFVEQIDSAQRRMSLGMVLKEVPVGYK